MSEHPALVCVDEPGAEGELVDGELAEASALSPPPPPNPPGLEERNLFAEADRIAARAATATTRGSTRRSSAPSATGSPPSFIARRWSAICTRT